MSPSILVRRPSAESVHQRLERVEVMDRRLKKAITITVSRGLEYQCPHCKEGAETDTPVQRPVTGAVLDLGRVVVEAECLPCRTVIAREFTLTCRFGSEPTRSWRGRRLQTARIYPLAQKAMRSGLYPVVSTEQIIYLCSRKYCSFWKWCEDEYGGNVNKS